MMLEPFKHALQQYNKQAFLLHSQIAIRILQNRHNQLLRYWLAAKKVRKQKKTTCE